MIFEYWKNRARKGRVLGIITASAMVLASCEGGSVQLPTNLGGGGSGACSADRTSFQTAARTAQANDLASSLQQSGVGDALSTLGLNPFDRLLQNDFIGTVGNISKALNLDARNLQQASNALDRLYDCRAAQAAELRRAARADPSKRQDSNNEIAVLQKRMDADIRLAERVLDKVDTRRENFRKATTQAKGKATTSAERAEVRKAEQSLQSSQTSFRQSDRKVSTVKTASAGSAFKLAIMQMFKQVITKFA